MQTMDKDCLPIFKYFRPQRKSKMLVHGFGDSAEDSLMFPLLRDGMYYVYYTIYEVFRDQQERNADKSRSELGTCSGTRNFGVLVSIVFPLKI